MPRPPSSRLQSTGALAEEQRYGEIEGSIWYDNVPHPKLVEYKKDQNWVRKSGDYLLFPGGGTQFKDGVNSYIQFIERALPAIEWGRHTRVVLDVGCGVASFGGYLLDKNVITMSFAPKDEHEAQIQFALERGIPAVLSVIGTQKLTFSDNAFDLIHCARCRVHWDGDGGKPLIELNRILRPGGLFVWSATPVYRDDPRDQSVWNAMVILTESICWRVVVKATDATGIGLVIYQKPTSNKCYEERKVKNPHLCTQKNRSSISWYTPLEDCLPPVHIANSDVRRTWPVSWPERLNVWPSNIFKSNSETGEERFYEDTKSWEVLVSGVYMLDLEINWSSIRNVMDMNASFGGFAAALVKKPVWVMNVVPIHGPNTLPIIFDRGLIGIYHDWCESFNTYPRTYDLLHSSFLFGSLSKRCDLVDVVIEMDRILRPDGWVLIQETDKMIKKLNSMLQTLHWATTIHKGTFLVAKKSFWRPSP
ncbi:probable methyltransferase PMT23 isoform X2 [Phalaenopsis equestris]|uniref:probable methyltransferase PMT23 isoform X2 n=1 Tax=Phalaenopsis equestris TaxID=78828 RepID=UPI0009E288DE|nr:probable methyltransferase PMT23 isoform X2 [Phalaenopsis equestris]